MAKFLPKKNSIYRNPGNTMWIKVLDVKMLKKLRSYYEDSKYIVKFEIIKSKNVPSKIGDAHTMYSRLFEEYVKPSNMEMTLYI